MPAKSDSLKIAMVLDDGLDKPDGVQQYILGLGAWLKSQGHSVDYLVGETTRTDIDGVISLSRNIHVSSNGNSMTIPLPTSRSKLRKHLITHKYDVLHVQTPYSPFMGGQLVTLAPDNTAVIGTFHILPNSRLISIGNRILGLWCYFSLRRFDKMLSVSDVAAEFASKTFHIESDVLPNVIDYPRFHDAQPLSTYDDDVKTILFLGRLVPRKGCLVLLQAIKKLHDSASTIPKFRVVICGTGPQRSMLEEYVANNGLQDLVEFAGFVDEEQKPQYYASADISVFPSSGGESFGIVLLEAMASGRATVLAGDNPGYRSVMQAEPQLLFDAKDPALLADKLAELLQDDNKKQAFAKWGSSYTAGFDVNVIGQKLVRIYGEALLNRTDQ